METAWYSYSIFNQIWRFSSDFRKSPQNQSWNSVQWEPRCCTRINRRTDIHDEVLCDTCASVSKLRKYQ
jgi:hypothetical protein